MSYKTENTNKGIEIIKRNKVENLELKKIHLAEIKDPLKGINVYLSRQKKKSINLNIGQLKLPV